MFPTQFTGASFTWEQVKLGDVAEITPGGTPSKNISDYWYPKEIPWLSSGEINKEIIFSTNDMISKKGFNNSSAKWINQNSVLIALAGQGKTRGKVAINRIPLTTNQSIAGIDPSDEIYYKFLYHQLTKDYLKLRLISSGDGSRGGLNKKLLNDYAVNLSGIDEQHKIGVLLSHIDNTLQLHERKCEELALIKKALLQKLFPKKDEFKPEVRYKNFSDAWEQRKLGEVTEYIKGFAFKSKDYKKSGHRIIRVSDLGKDSIINNNDSIFVTDEISKQQNKYKINKNEIIITTVGSKAELKESAVGRPIIVRNSLGYLLNQNLVKIHGKNNKDSRFIYYQLLQPRYSQYIATIQRGNANQANIAISDLWNYRIFITKHNEQQKIGNFFQQLDFLITLHQRKLEKLKQLKKFLLQNMFI
ncbi:restriction endonuclease subunit S [Ligilactobacillus salivarius]|uniref:restriction endonuclease subunit S n=3 Tax=Ligilactobacillus salivarius TaxID=1624 RepID=UPI0034DAD555